MKKLFSFLVLITSVAGSLYSQNQKVSGQGGEQSLHIAEIIKMVDLSASQLDILTNFDIDYQSAMDYAINKVEDKKESAELIYAAKAQFNDRLMSLLSDKQKVEYVRNSSYPEIMEKTKVKVDVLQETGNYEEKELGQFTSEIFEYLMLEKIAYICDKYNIKRQKENIAQLKKLQPQSLVTAEALIKAKTQGLVYQKGYKW